MDEPLVTYESGQRRYLHADERGSIAMVTDDAANVTFNRYDEYGRPQGPLTVGSGLPARRGCRSSAHY